MVMELIYWSCTRFYVYGLSSCNNWIKPALKLNYDMLKLKILISFSFQCVIGIVRDKRKTDRGDNRIKLLRENRLKCSICENKRKERLFILLAITGDRDIMKNRTIIAIWFIGIIVIYGAIYYGVTSQL